MSRFSVFLTGNKEWPVEISNGEGFGLQMTEEDAKIVLSGLIRVRLQLKGWTEEASAIEAAMKV